MSLKRSYHKYFIKYFLKSVTNLNSPSASRTFLIWKRFVLARCWTCQIIHWYYQFDFWSACFFFFQMLLHLAIVQNWNFALLEEVSSVAFFSNADKIIWAEATYLPFGFDAPYACGMNSCFNTSISLGVERKQGVSFSWAWSNGKKIPQTSINDSSADKQAIV